MVPNPYKKGKLDWRREENEIEVSSSDILSISKDDKNIEKIWIKGRLWSMEKIKFE